MWDIHIYSYYIAVSVSLLDPVDLALAPHVK